MVEMSHEMFDALRDKLKSSVAAGSKAVFPLEDALREASACRAEMVALVAALGVASHNAEVATNLLTIMNSASVGAAIAVKRVSERGGDSAGITSALVDLWGQAEAARALWFDTFVQFPGDVEAGREPALRETARLLGPQAVAIATQLHEPISQYIDFVSKVSL